MIDFRKPVLEDKEWVNEVLKSSRHLGCIYNFGQFYLWSQMYGTEIYRYKNSVLALAGDEDDKWYVYPAGEYDVREVTELLAQDAAERNIPLRFCAVEDWQAAELAEAFPERFDMQEDRADFDYIYNSSDLIELAGRKYHAKRNHISKFQRRHPDWKYEKLDLSNARECIDAAREWDKSADASDEGELSVELEVIIRAIELREQLDMVGGLIRADGRVVAFTLGERLNADSFVVHFEKALDGYREAYAVINREFAAHELSEYKYINREEDVGVEGLRKAKLSYYPAILLAKYAVCER